VSQSKIASSHEFTPLVSTWLPVPAGERFPRAAPSQRKPAATDQKVPALKVTTTNDGCLRDHLIIRIRQHIPRTRPTLAWFGHCDILALAHRAWSHKYEHFTQSEDPLVGLRTEDRTPGYSSADLATDSAPEYFLSKLSP
jgi:hypothetical protein